MEQHVIGEWDTDMTQLLMQVSFVDEFTLPLAEMISGNKDAYRIFEEAKEIGNFIEESEDGVYVIRPLLRTALQKRAHREYGSERCREIYCNAGLFYEMQDDVINALTMYEKSEKRERIKEILIRNARKNPGNGHYFELRKYYFSMSDEEIRKDALLMAGMSMLYSMLLQPDKSDYWYKQLEEYEKHQTGGTKREARSRLAYLDIALAQKGTHNILDIIKKIPPLLFDKGISLPEFSVTSNLPSIMNGGKDFCEWSKRDKELGASIGKLLALVLGAYGKGLVNIAVGESQYEKGGDTYEIMSMLNKGTMETQAGGKIEMAFAAAGIQARLNMIYGDEEAAWSILESFEERVREENDKAILINLNAMKCRLALYTGKKEQILAWMKAAPQEEAEFYILDRYRYLTKVRCYLFKGEYLRALSLLEKVQYYATLYERNYINIEVRILTAITKYRLREENWRETLLEGITLAQGYHFLRVISEEGAAVWELLDDKRVRKSLEKCEYIDSLYMETRKMANQFPRYLAAEINNPPEFSENALKILQLQAKGFTSKEIALTLKIKEETVRYHSRQNYKKLGVSGKTDAVLAARNLKLL